MKRQAILIPMILVLSVFGWSSPAAAQQADFTISVPVELNSLHPNVTGFFVQCHVTVGGQLVGAVVRSPEIGLDADGNYSGPPIIIEFTFPDVPYEQKSSVDAYNCNLRLYKGVGTFRPFEGSPDEDGQPKPGTTFNGDSSGPIVQGG